MPRAIATIDALPVKGSKANATAEKRYREAAETVILTSLPHGWAPDTVIIGRNVSHKYSTIGWTLHSQIMQPF